MNPSSFRFRQSLIGFFCVDWSHVNCYKASSLFFGIAIKVINWAQINWNDFIPMYCLWCRRSQSAVVRSFQCQGYSAQKLLDTAGICLHCTEQLVRAHSSHWADSDLFLFFGNLCKAEISFVFNYAAERKAFIQLGMNSMVMKTRTLQHWMARQKWGEVLHMSRGSWL